jgi:energy-coupling factor transporter ATP-binding protein EcfA2
MENLDLVEITGIKTVNGIAFPQDVNLNRLIVSGPPGSGKSTILKAINGWPEEGYIDISAPNWWKAPVLTNFPREFHFGLPFVGHEKAVPVYDTESLEDRSYLEVDLFRIKLPPPKTGLLSADFRSKFVFELIILDPETIFSMRKNRSEQGTHHVDEKLTLEDVREQVEYYKSLALFFHRSGMNVYIRDDLKGGPKRIRRDVPVSQTASDARHVYQQIDQLKLRQQILNRTWNLRGNKELLDLLVDVLPKAMKTEACSIYIHDPATQKVWLQSGTGLSERQIEVPEDGSIVGEVIKTGKRKIVMDMQVREGAHQRVDKEIGFVTRNVMCTPILSLTGNEVNGAISLLNKEAGKEFTDEDKETVQKLAYHLETAIENIFLRQEMMSFSEMLYQKMGVSTFWVRILALSCGAVILAQAVVIAYLTGMFEQIFTG